MASEVRTPIGARQRRIDGPQLLAGRARFVADAALGDELHLAIVRSTLPHATIEAIDLDRVRSRPDVRLAVSGAGIAATVGPIPSFIDPVARGAKATEVRCLAVDRVTYVGQPIAAVLASTPSAAAEAADAVDVRLALLPAVQDASHALAAGAPLLYPDWGDNLLLSRRYGSETVAASMERAPRVIDGDLFLQRCSPAPIEPRACIATWDEADGRLVVWATCQNPHALRGMIATACGLREHQVRVVCPRLGGAFGLKMAGHPEEILTAALALASRSTVRWTETRAESLKHGAREQHHRYRVGFDDDGRVVAFQDDIVADAGAATAQAGWGMPNLTALTLTTGYDLPEAAVGLRLAVTNKPPLAATRGFGKDSAHIVMERAMDHVAASLGIDPADVRARNFIPRDAFPYPTAAALNVDSGDYGALLDLALETSGYRQRRARQRELREARRLPGIGIGFEVTPESADGPGTQVSGFDTATVRMDPDGGVTALVGVTSPGGGNETGIAQVVAGELGVPIEAVTVVQGDTDRTPYGFGNFSGRSMLTGGGASALAARDLRAHLLEVSAHMLDAATEDLRTENGFVVGLDGGRRVSLAEVATAIATRAFQAIGPSEPVLEVTRSYKPENIDQRPDERGRIQPYPTYSSAVVIALLEVDGETGVVTLERIVAAHDCGTMINPALVEAQMQGAVAMGIGLALMEELRFEGGSLWSDRLKRYRVPRASDIPEVTVVHQSTPSPFTLFGNKGAGEAGVGGTAAAIVNAVVDALAQFDFRPERLPLDPPTLLGAIQGRASRRAVGAV